MVLIMVPEWAQCLTLEDEEGEAEREEKKTVNVGKFQNFEKLIKADHF